MIWVVLLLNAQVVQTLRIMSYKSPGLQQPVAPLIGHKSRLLHLRKKGHTGSTKLLRHSVNPVKWQISSGLSSASDNGSTATNQRPVLVLPGYLIDSKQMLPLVKNLRQRGYSAMLPPLRWYDWIPTIGGRPLRPVLDLVHYVLAEAASGIEVGEETDYEVPLPDKSTLTGWLEQLKNPSQGRVPVLPYREQVNCNQKVAVVASSAMGWITRILLGDGPEYWGRTYNGHEMVDALVTLGTPHYCGGRGISRENMQFVNTHYPGAYFEGIRYACIAGKSKKGERNLFPDFTYQSYELCAEKGDVWGDGVIPVDCALGLTGAENVLLDDVWHLPGDAKDGRLWYGSDGIIDEWIQFLE